MDDSPAPHSDGEWNSDVDFEDSEGDSVVIEAVDAEFVYDYDKDEDGVEWMDQIPDHAVARFQEEVGNDMKAWLTAHALPSVEVPRTYQEMDDASIEIIEVPTLPFHSSANTPRSLDLNDEDEGSEEESDDESIIILEPPTVKLPSISTIFDKSPEKVAANFAFPPIAVVPTMPVTVPCIDDLADTQRPPVSMEPQMSSCSKSFDQPDRTLASTSSETSLGTTTTAENIEVIPRQVQPDCELMKSADTKQGNASLPSRSTSAPVVNSVTRQNIPVYTMNKQRKVVLLKNDRNEPTTASIVYDSEAKRCRWMFKPGDQSGGTRTDNSGATIASVRQASKKSSSPLWKNRKLVPMRYYEHEREKLHIQISANSTIVVLNKPPAAPPKVKNLAPTVLQQQQRPKKLAVQLVGLQKMPIVVPPVTPPKTSCVQLKQINHNAPIINSKSNAAVHVGEQSLLHIQHTEPSISQIASTISVANSNGNMRTTAPALVATPSEVSAPQKSPLADPVAGLQRIQSPASKPTQSLEKLSLVPRKLLPLLTDSAHARLALNRKKTEPEKKPTLERPALSYCTLIALALRESGELAAPEICDYISSKYPYYATTKTVWRNNIRSTLSRSRNFMKMQVGRKGVYAWAIHPDRREKVEADLSALEGIKRSEEARKKMDNFPIVPFNHQLILPNVKSKGKRRKSDENMENWPFSGPSEKKSPNRQGYNKENEDQYC